MRLRITELDTHSARARDGAHAWDAGHGDGDGDIGGDGARHEAGLLARGERTEKPIAGEGP